MFKAFQQNDEPPGHQSSSLAARLRTGPVRSILDRIVRNAAEAAGIQSMALGICYPQNYEFISTHGVPLTHYQDRFHVSALLPELFDQDLEIHDLQTQPFFAGMAIVPVAKSWRYGASVPVRMRTALPDGGVLALSCADTMLRASRGKIPAIMRGYAELISDLIWLSAQIESAAIAVDPAAIIKAVLQAGMAHLKLAVCVVDADLRIVGHSKQFVETVQDMGWRDPAKGKPLEMSFVHTDVMTLLKESVTENRPLQSLRIDGDADRRIFLDLINFSFAEVGNFGAVSLHNGERAYAFLDAHMANEVREAPVTNSSWGEDRPGPVSRFLLETLINCQRLLRRGDVSYISLRKWRAAIKTYQIDALKALKTDVPESFIQAAAEEMAGAIQTVYGDVSKCVVVPVPCGSSGPNCLSCRIARRMSLILGIPMVEAFSPIEMPKGTSHPRRNVKRPKMRLLEEISQPVILVDDVATSGSHISEAAMLLRDKSPHVWSITWIAA